MITNHFPINKEVKIPPVMKVLTGLLPQPQQHQPAAADHPHLNPHHHYHTHPLAMMINDSGLHPSTTSPAIPTSTASGGGHNIHSIMLQPPDAHHNSTSSASYSNSSEDNKYSLVSK